MTRDMDEDSVQVLFLAHSNGIIGDEELICFLTALAEDEAAASKDDDFGPRFSLDAVADKACKELFRFSKIEIRRLRRLLLIPEDNVASNLLAGQEKRVSASFSDGLHIHAVCAICEGCLVAA